MEVPEDREMHFGLMPRSIFKDVPTGRTGKGLTPEDPAFYTTENITSKAGQNGYYLRFQKPDPALQLSAPQVGIEARMDVDIPKSTTPVETVKEALLDWKTLVAVGVVAVLCLLIFIL